MQKVFPFFFFGLFLFIFVPRVNAAPNVIVNNPPSTVTIGDNIILSVVLTNFSPSSQYYAKFRIGPTTSSLNDGETFSNSTWYSDSSDYVNFPKIILDASGSASFQLTSRAKVSSAQQGSNIFKIRMALTSDTSNQEDSQAYSITLSPAPTPTPTPTLAPTSTPTPNNAPTNTPTNSPTMTNTPTFIPTKTPMRRPSPSLTPSNTPLPQASSTGEVLSLSNSDIATPTATASGTLKPLIISSALVGTGLGMLSLLFIWQKRDALRPKPPLAP